MASRAWTGLCRQHEQSPVPWADDASGIPALVCEDAREWDVCVVSPSNCILWNLDFRDEEIYMP